MVGGLKITAKLPAFVQPLRNFGRTADGPFSLVILADSVLFLLL